MSWKQNLDPEVRRAYDREWYAKRPEYRKRQIALNRKRRAEIRTWFQDFKKTLKCKICGENRSPCLDFHHRDGITKEASLGEVIGRGWSQKRILEELDKCDVLCANCHRMEHAK